MLPVPSGCGLFPSMAAKIAFTDNLCYKRTDKDYLLINLNCVAVNSR